MSRLRIVSKNYVDISTLVADPVNTTINNLKTYSRSRNMLIPSATGIQNIKVQLGGAAPVSAIILGRHNFSVAVTIRIYMYNTNDWNPANEIYDSGILNIDDSVAGSSIIPFGSFSWGSIAWGQDESSEDFAAKASYVHWIPPPIGPIIGVQSIQVIIDVPSNLDIVLGRLIIGEYIEPTHTISYGHNITWTESTKQYRVGDDGTLRSTINAPTKQMGFSLNTINSVDRPILQDAFRYVGLRKDLFISLFHDDTDLDKLKDYSGIMKLTKIPSMSEYAPIYYKSSYVMEEV